MKNNLLKEITQVVFFTAVVFFSSYYFVPGVAEALGSIGSGYRADSGNFVDIFNIYSNPCKRVFVSGSDPNDYFVPTASQIEWDKFNQNKPSTVSINDCPSNPDAACTQTFTYAGQQYWGQWMGGGYDYLPDSQCWLVQNIDVGTMVTSTVLQNNGISEKYCYNQTADEDGYCSTGEGALYSQGEAKGYSGATSTGVVMGLCPPGWRVPKIADYQRLLEIINCTGFTTSACVRNGLGSLFPYTGRANWTGTNPPYSYSNLTDEGKYLTTEYDCVPGPGCDPMIFSVFASNVNYNPIVDSSGTGVALKCIKEWDSTID